MSTLKVFPIPDEVTRRIKKTSIDDFGHKLSISVGTENDTGWCRSSMHYRRSIPDFLKKLYLDG